MLLVYRQFLQLSYFHLLLHHPFSLPHNLLIYFCPACMLVIPLVIFGRSIQICSPSQYVRTSFLAHRSFGVSALTIWNSLFYSNILDLPITIRGSRGEANRGWSVRFRVETETDAKRSIVRPTLSCDDSELHCKKYLYIHG